MKKKILYFLLVSICFSSCKSDNKKEIQDKETYKVETSPGSSYAKEFHDSEKLKILVDKIVNKGDTIAYKKLRYIYYYSGHTAEFLPYSLIMANDYDFPLAYFNVYMEMNLLCADKSNSNKLANYYLFAAFEKKAEHAKGMIEQRFGKAFKAPNSKIYWKSLVKS